MSDVSVSFRVSRGFRIIDPFLRDLRLCQELGPGKWWTDMTKGRPERQKLRF